MSRHGTAKLRLSEGQLNVLQTIAEGARRGSATVRVPKDDLMALILDHVAVTRAALDCGATIVPAPDQRT